jgi:hypothetical protein
VSSVCRVTQGDGKSMFSWSHFIAHVHVYHDLYQCSNLRVHTSRTLVTHSRTSLNLIDTVTDTHSFTPEL